MAKCPRSLAWLIVVSGLWTLHACSEPSSTRLDADAELSELDPDQPTPDQTEVDIAPDDSAFDHDTELPEDVPVDSELEQDVAADADLETVELDPDLADDGSSPSCEPPPSRSPRWVVAPTGSPTAAGSLDDPMDLPTLLGASSPARAGDLVWLKGGRYVGRFRSRVAGSAEAPIVFAAEPGARVTLDGNAPGDEDGTLVIDGAGVQFHGLEITNSQTDRMTMGDGVVVYAADVKVVNCVIHDTSQGVGFWSNAVNSELYGNIIYNNGYEGSDRGHGHAIYTQNAQGTKRLVRNVIFFGYGFGIHAYTEGGSIRGFDIIENVWFRTGASVSGASNSGTSDGCLVGGQQPVANTRLLGNLSWAPSVGARGVQLGYGGSVQNEDVTLRQNFFIGQLKANGSWTSGTLEENTFHSALSGIEPLDYPNNVWSSSLPSGTKVLWQHNAFDAQRATLVIYNGSMDERVAVEPSAVLPVGANFQLHSVFDLWGAPLLSGTYSGEALEVPMGSVAAPQPNGASGNISGADDPGRAFGVFVLRSDCELSTP